MKLDSKWFDRIRIRREEKSRTEERVKICDVHGCGRAALHRAPMGRLREGEYYHFCLEHVRDYNRSYNWFDGMTDADVSAWMASRLTGHRPTWSMGANTHARSKSADAAGSGDTFRPEFFVDPFDMFSGVGGPDAGAGTAERRRVGNAERKSLEALGLDETATGPEIKARYKELVKRHHPDANGGDRSKEARLRQIIEAYNMLKASGFYRNC